MKQKKITNVLGAVGVISSSFLLQACESANSADELNQILESHNEESMDPIGVPVNLTMSKSDREYISFLQKLSIDIIDNPDIAKEFANNPEEFCRKYGYNKRPNLDDAMIKYILALGNKEIASAVQKGDVNAYIAECKKEGIINLETLKKDPYLQKISDYFSRNKGNISFDNLTRADTNVVDINNTESLSAVYGFVAIAIAAIAVEAAVVLGTTLWVTHVHQSSHHKDKGYTTRYADTNDAIELWELKADTEHVYMAADSINDAIVNEGMDVIKDNFPEVFEKVDKETLRKIILLNVQKNASK